MKDGGRSDISGRSRLPACMLISCLPKCPHQRALADANCWTKVEVHCNICRFKSEIMTLFSAPKRPEIRAYACTPIGVKALILSFLLKKQACHKRKNARENFLQAQAKPQLKRRLPKCEWGLKTELWADPWLTLALDCPSSARVNCSLLSRCMEEVITSLVILFLAPLCYCAGPFLSHQELCRFC